MNPPTPPPFAGLSGLSRGEIYRVANIADLGAPRHMSYQRDVMVYTPEGLSVLADTLQVCGHTEAAAALREILDEERLASFGRHEAMGRPEEKPAPTERRSWTQKWEGER